MIVGITGAIGSGKDTIADYLINYYSFRKMSYAAPLKDAVAAIFNWDRDMLEGTTKVSREWREQVDEWWSKRLDIPQLSPRWVLQQWGTEVGRRCFHDDIWVASIENKLKQISDSVVISDCRFANEVYSIKRAGGIIIRVERGEPPEWYSSAIALNSKNSTESEKKDALSILSFYKIHASEYSSVGLNYDHVIQNNGSLVDLYSKIDSIINL